HAREALQQRHTMTIAELRTQPRARGSRPKSGNPTLVSIQFPPTRPDRPDPRDPTDQHQQVTDRAELGGSVHRLVTIGVGRRTVLAGRSATIYVACQPGCGPFKSPVTTATVPAVPGMRQCACEHGL